MNVEKKQIRVPDEFIWSSTLTDGFNMLQAVEFGNVKNLISYSLTRNKGKLYSKSELLLIIAKLRVMKEEAWEYIDEKIHMFEECIAANFE